MLMRSTFLINRNTLTHILTHTCTHTL